jgi:hypothetical protein
MTRRAGSVTDSPELRALGLALVVSLLLWQLPFGGVVLYPFKLLATWMHETSHALVMLASGAGFDHMEVYRDGSGLAYARHGVGNIARAFIAAAGYMGTPLCGAALLTVAQRSLGARRSLGGIGVLLVASALLVVGRFGQVAVVATGAVAIAAALALRDRHVVLLANFVAAQACINAVVDIRVLFRPTLMVDGQAMGRSDAHTMAAMTFGTNAPWAIWFWASMWLLWSLVLFAAALVLARRHRAAETRTAPLAADAAAAGS